MKKELEQKLFENHPLIFFRRNNPIKNSLMGASISVGDGWFDLINILCYQLTDNYRRAKNDYEFYLKFQTRSSEIDILNEKRQINPDDPNVKNKIFYSPIHVEKARLAMQNALDNTPVALQVKEKFGTLRFYTDRNTPVSYALINMAESLSSTICEVCGDKALETSEHNGWIHTLCAKHHNHKE